MSEEIKALTTRLKNKILYDIQLELFGKEKAYASLYFALEGFQMARDEHAVDVLEFESLQSENKRLREELEGKNLKLVESAYQWFFDHEGDYDCPDAEAIHYAKEFLSKHKDL